MSKSQMLRLLVNERLTAAAEEIFELFERTIVEYEEELCRYKEGNQVNKQLDREEGQRSSTTPAARPDPGLGLELTDTPWIKEEQRIKEEEEQLPKVVPEFSVVCVKSEDFSLLHGQTEHRGETQEDQTISAEPRFQPETEGHTEPSPDECGPQATCSWAEMETEVGHKSVPEKSVPPNVGNSSKTDKERRCLVYRKTKRKDSLQVFTDIVERPYTCSFCSKTFAYKQRLDSHTRIHTGEKPFKCSYCEKHFAEQSNLKAHLRTHTGERPYICSICDKTYRFSSDLKTHMRTHTGEKPFRCSQCTANFRLQLQLKRHMSSHTGGKPFSCSDCDKTFHELYNLNMHMRTHTGEKPFSCSMCDKTFAQLCNLKSHLTTHTGGNKLNL